MIGNTVKVNIGIENRPENEIAHKLVSHFLALICTTRQEHFASIPPTVQK